MYASSEENITGIATASSAAEAEAISYQVKVRRGEMTEQEATQAMKAAAAAREEKKRQQKELLKRNPAEVAEQMLKQEMAFYEKAFGQPMPQEMVERLKRENAERNANASRGIGGMGGGPGCGMGRAVGRTIQIMSQNLMQGVEKRERPQDVP